MHDRQILRKAIALASLSAASTGVFAAMPEPYRGIPVPGAKRDPFTASEAMHSRVGTLAADAASSGRGFVSTGVLDQIPRMRLRGFVTHPKPVAVLDIEGVGTYLVRKGDEIGLQAVGKNTVIKVIDVDGMSVKIQSGTINQVIVVR